MQTLTRLTLLPLFLALSSLAGCGAAAKMSEMAALPSDEVKRLEEEVGLIDETLAIAKKDADTVGDMPKDVDPASLNPAKLRKAMEDCFAEPITEVKAAAAGAKKKAGKAAAGKVTKDEAKTEGDQAAKKGKKVYGKFKDCMGRRKENAGKLKDAAPGGKTDFVKAKLDTVDHLRKSIHFLKGQSKSIPGLLKDVATTKVKAMAAHKATQNNPLASAKDKQANDAEFKKLDTRLDKLTNILKKDLANLPGDIAGIATKAGSAIK